MIKQKFLELLCCPLGKAELKQDDNCLICSKCGLRFPVKEGIPVLLVEEAVMPEGTKDIHGLLCMKEKL